MGTIAGLEPGEHRLRVRAHRFRAQPEPLGDRARRLAVGVVLEDLALAAGDPAAAVRLARRRVDEALRLRRPRPPPATATRSASSWRRTRWRPRSAPGSPPGAPGAGRRRRSRGPGAPFAGRESPGSRSGHCRWRPGSARRSRRRSRSARSSSRAPRARPRPPRPRSGPRAGRAPPTGWWDAHRSPGSAVPRSLQIPRQPERRSR